SKAIMVARYNPDGSLDTSFGAGGVASTSLVTTASAVAIQADGKIVVAGNYYSSPGVAQFALARLTATGALDGSFGAAGNGAVVTPIFQGDLWDTAYDMALQSDGKIVVVGARTPSAGAGNTGDFLLVRYTPGGALDTSFGPAGNGAVK